MLVSWIEQVIGLKIENFLDLLVFMLSLFVASFAAIMVFFFAAVVAEEVIERSKLCLRKRK